MINTPYPTYIPIQPVPAGVPVGLQAPLGAGAYGNGSRSAYQHAAVETATPEKLLLMLYNGVVRFLNKGGQALQENNLEQANESLTRALDIIAELNATLNMDAGGDIAQGLRDLYNFYSHEVLMANIKHDPALLEPVIAFFEEFRKVWIDAVGILQQDTSQRKAFKGEDA